MLIKCNKENTGVVYWMCPTPAKNLEQICHKQSVQHQFFNLFLSNAREHLFLKSKGKLPRSWFEEIIVSRSISSKGMAILEVLSILSRILLYTFRRMRLKYEKYVFERHLILDIQTTFRLLPSTTKASLKKLSKEFHLKRHL